MNYILYDDAVREALKPMTYTRPVCDIRLGIMTIREKWEKFLGEKTSTLTEDYLAEKYPTCMSEAMMLINGSVCPTQQLVDVIKNMTLGQTLLKGEIVIAVYKTREDFLSDKEESSEEIEFDGEFTKVNTLADLFQLNDKEIRSDFKILTQGRKSQPLSSTNRVLGDDIFVEEGAKVEFAILNASTGPIYIGKDAEIMENAAIRGPFAMCEHTVVRMSSKIYGGTTLGPYCKVGGEVSNLVMYGYSSKIHDGYFGNSVLGEWCNIGADSNTSTLKNNYADVRLWSIGQNTFVPTGTKFVGTIMGDHSKCGINTMFNTGSVIGVYCNIFGHGYQRNYIPSFSWGGITGVKVYEIESAIKVAEIVEARRDIVMSEVDKNILRHVYKEALKDRRN